MKKIKNIYVENKIEATTWFLAYQWQEKIGLFNYYFPDWLHYNKNYPINQKYNFQSLFISFGV